MLGPASTSALMKGGELTLRFAPTETTSFEASDVLVYGRAIATTVNQRMGDLLLDMTSDVAKLIAEQPQLWQELQVSSATSGTA